jgi:predicted site-specific integrase-resolvase
MAYARGSGPDQKADLERQKAVVERYCAGHGWRSRWCCCWLWRRRLTDTILDGPVGRLVIAHEDQLLHLGAQRVFAICAARNVALVIGNQGEDTTCKQDLCRDVLEIITVFSHPVLGRAFTKDPETAGWRAVCGEAGTELHTRCMALIGYGKVCRFRRAVLR